MRNDCQPVGSPMPGLNLKTTLILDHEQYNMLYEGNLAENFEDKIN